MNNYHILINKENLIDREFYKNFNFVEILNVENDIIKIEKLTYEKYLELKIELKEKENIELGILNSFRTFEEQEEICEEYVKIYGEEDAYKLAAVPGTSEHHSGLAIDITVKINENDFALSNQELYDANEIFLKVHKYLAKFGFILRYPKDKTEITKYNYEPWHIRYVGNDIAEICDKQNITLEEYYEKID